MSIEERIALLESEKLQCVSHFDAAITGLWKLKQSEQAASDQQESSSSAPKRSRPFTIKGKPLSQTILEDRGAR